MICFAGRRLAVLATPPQTLERSTGIAPVLPDWRSGVLLLYELRLGERRVSAVVRELFARAQQRSVAEPSYKWSEQRESNSRHRVGGPRHQPLYHARFNKLWRSQRELNRGPQHAPILLLRVMGWLEPVPPDRQYSRPAIRHHTSIHFLPNTQNSW